MRRITSVVQPLNYLYTVTTTKGEEQTDHAFAQQNSISMPAINQCMSLLNEVQEFLSAANVSFKGVRRQ